APAPRARLRAGGQAPRDRRGHRAHRARPDGGRQRGARRDGPSAAHDYHRALQRRPGGRRDPRRGARRAARHDRRRVRAVPAAPVAPRRDTGTRTKVRDPYADLLRDTRGLRREQAAARDAWYSSLSWERKEETLFELEMLMKGLVCFANPRNHPGPSRKAPIVAMDFREELIVARHCVARIIALCRLLLGTRDRAYVFQRYLEGLLPDDPARARLNRDA